MEKIYISIRAITLPYNKLPLDLRLEWIEISSVINSNAEPEALYKQLAHESVLYAEIIEIAIKTERRETKIIGTEEEIIQKFLNNLQKYVDKDVEFQLVGFRLKQMMSLIYQKTLLYGINNYWLESKIDCKPWELNIISVEERFAWLTKNYISENYLKLFFKENDFFKILQKIY